MKKFNTTAICIPSKHYMVDLSSRIAQIRKMVDAGEYFTINRARQYGKTTTLNMLRKTLGDSYNPVSLDFQKISTAGFSTEKAFCQTFAGIICDGIEYGSIYTDDETATALKTMSEDDSENVRLDHLFRILRKWCHRSEKPIVLMIDEVDSAANNQVFLDFLAQLREGYINRAAEGIPAFQSVILAGVADIKHLKSKIRDEDQHKVNSPWNIATDFLVDMSFHTEDIQGMLEEYEADHHTGMDTGKIAGAIEMYTGGYPYLVSRICQVVDERLVPDVFPDLFSAWTAYGVDEAVKQILAEKNMLFESVTGKLTNYPELKKQIRNILLRGDTYAWMPYNEQQQLLFMYGLIRNDHNTVAIANRMFEMLLYTQFISENKENEVLKQLASAEKSVFVSEDGWLDVPKIMEHFIREHNRIHPDQRGKFLEEKGRERFLTYLSPILNGTGTYSIEEQTRTHQRMDVVIHYLGRRYVIELKIWHGSRYNEKGEKQIREYLDYFGLSTGYMLSFNFNRRKESGVRRVQIGDKILFEGIV